MVLNWARKGGQMGLSVIPVPDDPFALPITLNSDPVRGPIFIQVLRAKTKFMSTVFWTPTVIRAFFSSFVAGHPCPAVVP